MLVSLWLFLFKKPFKKEIFKILHIQLKGLTILVMKTMSYLFAAPRSGNTREARLKRRELQGLPRPQHQSSASGITNVHRRVKMNSSEPEPSISGRLIA